MIRGLAESLRDGHALVVGGTRRGKSGLLQLMARSLVRRGFDGLTAIDPHGEFARAVAAWLANPRNGQHDRRVHVLDPASSDAFGANPLENDGSWEGCHDAAVLLASVIESRFGASPEETPRLARIVYVAAMAAARKQLTVLEMIELLSLGAESLRRSVLVDFDNRVVRRELEDLYLLADKQPARFLEYVESTKNRFVRLLGDRRLARILGQKTGLNPRAVMDGRDIVLVDLSALAPSDAAFVGALVTSMYAAAAMRRPPLRSARHRLILDEAESLITVDTARLVDRCAKFGLNLIAAVQRLGQLRAKGDFIADALLGNVSLKIVFGGLEAESAEYMARQLFTGHIDLAEWKPGSVRPTVVGQDKVTVRNRSHADHEAEHESRAATRSHTRAHARAETTSTAFGTATATGAAASSAEIMTPDTGILSLPSVLQQSASETASTVTTESMVTASAVSDAVIEGEGYAETTGSGKSRGRSDTIGESECFVSRFEWLPSAQFTLEEQLHRLTGELMNLDRRWCFVKVEGARPYKTRTQDLDPPFRSIEFQTVMVPAYLRASTLRSPYLHPAAAVDEEIAARLIDLEAVPRPAPEPDIAARDPFPSAAELRAVLAEASKPTAEPPPVSPQLQPKRPRKGGKPTLVVANDAVIPRPGQRDPKR